MKSIIEKQEDGNITLTINLPWDSIKKTSEEIIQDYVKNAELPGFRKGKAPKKLVEEKINKEKVKEEALRKLIPQGYINAITEHSLKPIVHPRIDIKNMEDKKDWTFIATTTEAPAVDLNNYKKAVKSLTAKSKIIVPGKEQQPVAFEEIAKELLKVTKVNVPKIMIDTEVEKLLSQTLGEIKKLGLTLEQYFTSTGKTAESLREEYAKKAENDLKMEFVLQKIANEEKISVEEKEIEEAILQAKTETEKQNLQQNRYLLATILRQQKTLDFIKNL
ncbi:hypothetical protein KKG52_00020 [Patescibacteria group bacterium]|nr:hypothetical protein [Patescibacteria group bacterium]